MEAETQPKQGTIPDARPIDKGFGPWIRRMREAKGMQRRSEFAKLTGLSQSMLTDLEFGRSGRGGMSSVAMFERLARGLDIDLGFVLQKAGFPIERDDDMMERLIRVERLLDALDQTLPDVRRALAECQALFAAENGEPLSVPPIAADAHEARVTVNTQTSRALAALDVLAARLSEGRK